MPIGSSAVRNILVVILVSAAVLVLAWQTNRDERTVPWFFDLAADSAAAFGIRQGLLAAAAALAGSGLVMATRRWQWALAALLLVGITPVVLGGFWWSLGEWGISDWDYYFSYHESLRRIVLEHRQFPLWNPYICGGTAGIGEPESPMLTPTFVLELLFGVPQGLRLAIFFATSVGALGMLALARRIGLSVHAALLAAIVFAFGNVNILEIVEGHPNIFSAMWVPWIFWSWLGAYRRPHRLRYLLCGLFLALTFFQGGIYLLMYTGLAFLVLPWLTRSPRRAYLTTLHAGLWALGFASIKLLPALLWLKQFQDEAYASTVATLSSLHHILLGRYPHGVEDVIPQQGSGWHEYGAYVGPVALILALLGALAARRQHLTRMLVLAALLALLLSSAGPLLKPFFDTAPYLPRSNISRFILFAVLPLSLLAGMGAQQLASPRRRYWLGPLLIGLVAADLFTLAYPLSQQAFILDEVHPAPSPAPSPLTHTIADYRVRVDGVDYTRAYAATLAGYGTLTYCSTLGPPPAIQAIEAPENTDYLNPPPGGSATLQAWSPNSLTVAVTAPEPGRLTINSNYATGWTVNDQPALNDNGRLATLVPIGTSQQSFAYQAPGFLPGAALTLATGLAALALAGRVFLTRRQHRKVA